MALRTVTRTQVANAALKDGMLHLPQGVGSGVRLISPMPERLAKSA